VATGNSVVPGCTEDQGQRNVPHGRTITMMSFVINQLIMSYMSQGSVGHSTTKEGEADDDNIFS
jgi:hypothetical protein